jgi:hypothetical protein
MVLSVLLRFSISGCPFVVLPIRPEMGLSRAFYKSDIFLIAGALSERRRFLIKKLYVSPMQIKLKAENNV